ncbi:hypothetical protein V2J09_014132 [Rumex salicifolius]
MFTKILTKLSPNPQKSSHQSKTAELNPRVIVHYGIPSTASRLAYDPIQHILAIGTLDGRIKVIGNDNIEGLLISPKTVPFKNLEFLQNQGFLVGISNENDVTVWDLEQRCIASSMHWESNITAFSVIPGTSYMYIGDDCGSVYVVVYNVEERKLLQLPYQISSESVSEALGVSSLNNHSIVGVLTQPCSRGNRIMFAYDNGMIVLWDIYEDKMVLTRGCKDLHLKDKLPDDSATDTLPGQSTEASDDEDTDKEISSLCWASLDGSVLAVGYVDGDIMLWDLRNDSPSKDHKPDKSVNHVFKLQLSADKRFPVILLNWCPSTLNRNNGHGGRLFVYGGDEIGTAEVLTVLSLEWASGREALRSVARVDLTLDGSFADMILLRNDTKENNDMASLFILTNPGQLQFYDDSCLTALVSHQENFSPRPVEYSSIVRTIEPHLTVGRLCLMPKDAEYSRAFLEMTSTWRSQGTHGQMGKNRKWPLSGGVPCNLSLSGEMIIERLYIAGYKDGSVVIYDATYPVLLPLFILESEISDISIAGSTTPISALDVSSSTLSLGIGSESGLVRLYTLKSSPSETTLIHVTEAGKEAHQLDQGNGPYCSAIFSICPSRVSILRYTNLGDRLAIGYESGQVGMLDVGALSVLFLTEAQQLSTVVSLDMRTFSNGHPINVNKKHSESEELSKPAKELVFVLRGDSHISFLNSITGSIICSHAVLHGKESNAVSMHILDDKSSTTAVGGESLQPPSGNNEEKGEHAKINDCSQSKSVDVGSEAPGKDDVARKRPVGSLVLVCLVNRLQLYPLSSLFQESTKPIFEIKVQNAICWAATCIKDGSECRLILLYQTGVIEIRSLPDLEVVEESSLASIMRWNFKSNMERTISYTNNGHVVMVNGSEFAVISLLSYENDFRIPQSWPCLHDKTLAAAYTAHLAVSPRQKKNKETLPGMFVGLVKGLRLSKDETVDPSEAQKVDSATMEKIFFKIPPETTGSTGEVVELSIDDIHIDEPLRIEPSNPKDRPDSKDEKEREKLFEGGTSTTKPKQRSIEEIKAKYRPVSDAASAAKEAKNKLLERQEKLERLTKNTEELQDGAQNFASMAQELAKRMENRKWWQI